MKTRPTLISGKRAVKAGLFILFSRAFNVCVSAKSTVAPSASDAVAAVPPTRQNALYCCKIEH